MKQAKFIFVTGGVCSSLGKGLTASSIGALLETFGYTITLAKIDPYINIDAGTMSPIEHGEVYVTEDGTETDLDLGNYARFTSYKPTKMHSITTGQVYKTIIEKERKGDYLGKCVQVIPHLTDEIKQRIYNLIEPNIDIAIVELGGTVGDIESTIFLQAIRQLIKEITKQHVILLHLTLIPNLPGDKELKTKPTQHSVQRYTEILGMEPDILLCRLEHHLPPQLKKKISLLTHIPQTCIIPATNFQTTPYELPTTYHKQGLSKVILKKLNLEPSDYPLTKWTNLLEKIKNPQHEINIGLIAKYTTSKSAYISVYEALEHAGVAHRAKIKTHLIDSEKLTLDELKPLDGILVPGGFGARGIEGKIQATKYARENNIPFLGICLGLHVLIIEYARHVAHLQQANSTEFEQNTPFPVIHLLPTQSHIQNKGGTMRLGTYQGNISPNTLLEKAYKTTVLHERHRHRYEINTQYAQQLIKKGLKVSCTTKIQNQELIEAVELPDHPYFLGVQFHPEFLSKPNNPHPLFSTFIHSILMCK